MSTSGTIGTTRITTVKLLEKAIRRCGLTPASLTPETIDSAKEDMFMFLLTLSTRGLNLWCVENVLQGVIPHKKLYTLATGTLDILNLMFCTPSCAASTLATTASSITADLTSATRIVRVGVQFGVLPTSNLTLVSSPNNSTWTTVKTINVADLPAVGEYYWFDLDPSVSDRYFKLSSASGFTATDYQLATSVKEIPLTPYNRDDYSALPNKNQEGAMVTNYFFEKKINPQFTAWPVPTDPLTHFNIYRHRQVQDVGTLAQELEIPNRWYEPVTWHLALRLSFELPGVEKDRRAEIKGMTDEMTLATESSETDNAPVYFAPNIGVYTR